MIPAHGDTCPWRSHHAVKVARQQQSDLRIGADDLGQHVAPEHSIVIMLGHTHTERRMACDNHRRSVRGLGQAGPQPIGTRYIDSAPMATVA